MLEHLILMLSLIGSGHVGLGTVFGSSHWDRSNPHSRLACLHREINDRDDRIIAHNTLPCGTRVWIFNPRTGLSTVAEVADRGPRHAYADLSRNVASAIGHNGRESILLVALPSPLRPGSVVTRRVPAPVEESWEVPHPVREVPALAASVVGPALAVPEAQPVTETETPPELPLDDPGL